MSATDSPSKPSRFEPPISEPAEEFWEATRERRFVIQWCSSCEAPIFYPREMCPQCLASDTLEWRPSDGKGTVYAFSVQHRPANPLMADKVPYTVALVELTEGIRMMTNIVGCDPSEVEVGMPVNVSWEPLSDGRNLPLFAPSATS